MSRAEDLARGKVEADRFLTSIYALMLTKGITRMINANKDEIKRLEADVRQGEKNLQNVENL